MLLRGLRFNNSNLPIYPKIFEKIKTKNKQQTCTHSDTHTLSTLCPPNPHCWLELEPDTKLLSYLLTALNRLWMRGKEQDILVDKGWQRASSGHFLRALV